MGHFDRENRGGGKFGKRNFGGDRGGFRPKPFMHKAICSNCGAECEVPFRPVGDRPVYCNNCFKKGDNPGRANNGARFHDRPPRHEQNAGSQAHGVTDSFNAQFEVINNKLERILQVLTSKTEAVSPSEAVAESKKSKTTKTKPVAKKTKKKSK